MSKAAKKTLSKDAKKTMSKNAKTTVSLAAKKARIIDASDSLLGSSEDDTEDSEYDSEIEEMFAEGRDAILDRLTSSAAEDSGSDWEPDTRDTHPPSFLESPTGRKRRQSSFAAARCAWGRSRRERSPRAPHTEEEEWHSEDDVDVEPAPLVFMPVRSPGPQQKTRVANSPLQFFRLFFTDDVLETLLANTNANGAKKHVGKKGAWRDITMNDMFSFIAMVIYMGLLKCSTLVDYWKGSRLFALPFPPSVMSRNKFLTISRALHLSDIKADEKNDTKRGTPEYDRLGKIKPLYEHIVTACKLHFQPGQHISIDERMVASKAKKSIKFCIRNKPTKWGYKLFVLTDSSCGYIWNFYVHESKSSGSGKGQSYDSVMSLMDLDSLGKGYHLYVDNYYTSSQLFQDLLKKGIGACGVIRANRVGFPKTKANDFTRDTLRGTIRWIRDNELLFVKWMDTREVVMCSTIHRAFDGEMARRRVKTAGKWMQTEVPIPAAVKDYNQHMGGVDLSDALSGYYSVIHKTRKWYRTFFYHFVGIAVVNAHILHQQCQKDSPMTQKDFRQALVEELADHGSESRSQASSKRYTAPPDPAASHKLRYFSTGLNVPKREASTAGRRSCTLCHRKTPVGCVTCNVPLCFVAQRDCFNTWHTQKGL